MPPFTIRNVFSAATSFWRTAIQSTTAATVMASIATPVMRPKEIRREKSIAVLDARWVRDGLVRGYVLDS